MPALIGSLLLDVTHLDAHTEGFPCYQNSFRISHDPAVFLGYFFRGLIACKALATLTSHHQEVTISAIALVLLQPLLPCSMLAWVCTVRTAARTPSSRRTMLVAKQAREAALGELTPRLTATCTTATASSAAPHTMTSFSKGQQVSEGGEQERQSQSRASVS